MNCSSVLTKPYIKNQTAETYKNIVILLMQNLLKKTNISVVDIYIKRLSLTTIWCVLQNDLAPINATKMWLQHNGAMPQFVNERINY